MKYDPEEEDISREQAMYWLIMKKMCNLETGITTIFWNDILSNLNKSSSTVQSSKINVNTAAACVKSFREFISEKKKILFHTMKIWVQSLQAR